MPNVNQLTAEEREAALCRAWYGHDARWFAAAAADFVGQCNGGNGHARFDRHKRRWFVRDSSQQRILLHAASAYGVQR